MPPSIPQWHRHGVDLHLHLCLSVALRKVVSGTSTPGRIIPGSSSRFARHRPSPPPRSQQAGRPPNGSPAGSRRASVGKAVSTGQLAPIRPPARFRRLTGHRHFVINRKRLEGSFLWLLKILPTGASHRTSCAVISLSEGLIAAHGGFSGGIGPPRPHANLPAGPRRAARRRAPQTELHRPPSATSPPALHPLRRAEDQVSTSSRRGRAPRCKLRSLYRPRRGLLRAAKILRHEATDRRQHILDLDIGLRLRHRAPPPRTYKPHGAARGSARHSPDRSQLYNRSLPFPSQADNHRVSQMKTPPKAGGDRRAEARQTLQNARKP